MRDKIFDIMEGNSDSLISKLIGWVVILAILVSSVGFVLESVEELRVQHEKLFELLDLIVVAIFTLEYAIRLITVRKRLEFVGQPLNIIDILAIAPFYLELLLGNFLDLRILRLIRLIRIFRLFKMARYSESMAITAAAFRATGAALISLTILMGILLIISSSLMYFAEHDAHVSHCLKPNSDGTLCLGKWVEGTHSPDKAECPLCHKQLELPTGTAQVAKNFRSIVTSFWWCIVTMTTVGYGDVVPQTALGKILAGFTMLAGILCIALPTGVIATAFNNQFEEARKKKLQLSQAEPAAPACEITCPHCQQKFKHQS